LGNFAIWEIEILENRFCAERRLPQALKRGSIFSDLAARVELGPFPNRLEPEFSATSELGPFPFVFHAGAVVAQADSRFLVASLLGRITV
jgi:hypothetical protein